MFINGDVVEAHLVECGSKLGGGWSARVVIRPGEVIAINHPQRLDRGIERAARQLPIAAAFSEQEEEVSGRGDEDPSRLRATNAESSR